jgi:nucleoside-diphosphate-sugar epimerase
MNILVVGGAGYVGGGLIDLLQDSDHNVTVYDNLLYEECYRREVPFVYGDVRDKGKLLPLILQADVVVWLAAMVGDGACAVDPKLTNEVNVDSVRWLAQVCTGRIIYMSTCSVYGANQGTLTEASDTNPLSLYAETKLKTEKYLSGGNALIFRLGTLFGVSDNYSRLRLDLVANTLVARAHTQGKITVFGGDQFRPLLHVNDVAKAIQQGLTNEATGIYNLHRQNVRIFDLACQVRCHYPDIEMEVTEMSFEDSRNYKVSSDKARRELQFKPEYTIDDGLIQVSDVIKDRIVDPNSKRYHNHGFMLEKVEQSK